MSSTNRTRLHFQRGCYRERNLDDLLSSLTVTLAHHLPHPPRAPLVRGWTSKCHQSVPLGHHHKCGRTSPGGRMHAVQVFHSTCQRGDIKSKRDNTLTPISIFIVRVVSGRKT